MKALTVWQPWAWLLACADPRLACEHFKLIETRRWSPRSPHLVQAREMVGQDIFIHAAKRNDDEAEEELLEDGVVFPDGLAFYLTEARGAIVAVARLRDVRPLEKTTADWLAAHSVGIDPTFAFPELVDDGITALVLDRETVRALRNPVPVRGNQGWWNVDRKTARRALQEL